MAESLHEMAKRLCDNKHCSECTFRDGFSDVHNVCLMGAFLDKNIDEQIKLLTKWAEENPPKTYLDDFNERFPNRKNPNSIDCIGCPQAIYHGQIFKKDYECDKDDCEACWGKPFGFWEKK